MDSQYVDGKTFSLWKMVQDSHSSRTYVQIRRMILVLLRGVSDLFNIMPNYLDEVRLREMMHLMLSDDTDSDDGAHDLTTR
jgi:hypothetical protein